ncbi:hypothetical protein [Streptococcus halotolerans]|uniref:hypothetical protein n=1 Tax=Streptococcus halotolerans TaxID=1814128 RepID=UPI0007869671|nr:hypothetical protein [Streptococcus halotolerans]
MFTKRVTIWLILCIIHVIFGIYQMFTNETIFAQWLLIATGIFAPFAPLFYYLIIGIILFIGLDKALDERANTDDL